MSADDHQKPSTSREGNLWSEGSSPTRTLKRESSTNSDRHVDPKKPRVASNNASQDKRNDEKGIGTYAAAGSQSFSNGNTYQLKYLMLILYRAWKRKYPFRLATEMIPAEKFDDVVLAYRDDAGNEVHSFVQMKQNQDGNKTIRDRDLLANDISNEPFSILKYFKKWRKIKKHPDFSGRKLKHFILSTNIGLDVKGLKEKKIEISDYVRVKDEGSESKSKVRRLNEFLIVVDEEKSTPLYNLRVDKGSRLHHKLKLASNANVLARKLAQHVYKDKMISETTPIFKDYDAALTKEIIDTQSRKLSLKFVRNNGLSEEAEKLRTIFLRNIKALRSNKSYLSDEVIWKRLRNLSLKISEKFGEKLQSATRHESNTFIELPDDDISYQEILDFVGEFVLAVNQPDEVELGKMMKREIGSDSEFNLLNAALVADALLNDMLDWFRKGSGEFLVNKSADDFFEKIKFKLSSFIATGVTLEYLDKLDKCGIRFKRESTEVRNLVDSSDSTAERILQFINPSQTFLTALQVYQTLMQIQKFKRNDSILFITLKSLLLPKIMKGVLLDFKSLHNHDLLIVNCESISAKQYRKELWNPLCNIMKENTNKKMILIIQGTIDSAIHFENSYKLLPENDDDNDINSLEKSAQQKLLERNVIRFQGKEGCFRRLFGIQDVDNIESKKLTDLGRIIDAKILVQLIKENEIQIGCGITGLSKIQSSYYIPRKIVRHVVIKVDILKASGIEDLLAIGGFDRETLKKLVGNETVLRSFDDSSQIDSQQRVCFVLDHDQEADQFKVLCQRNANRKIHWLQCVSEKLIWTRSLGDVSNLVEYKDTNRGDRNKDKENEVKDDRDRLSATYLDEDDLVDFDEQQRIVILSDITGMGKTTILTYLAQEIKDKQPSSLVITINLTRRTDVLNKEKVDRTFGSNNTDGAVDFLVDKLERLDTDLERQVYKTILKGDGEAALLFDGFDEISPAYGHIVVDLLQALVRLPKKKIIVTTRPHTSKALEKGLGTFSHSLQPFSRENQMQFLTKFWTQGLSENYSDETLEKRLELHAKRVIELLDNSVDYKMMDVTGVPLQTMMAADLYYYRSTAKGDTSDKTDEMTTLEDVEAKLPEKIDMIDLYRTFVDQKFEILFTQKQSGNSINLYEVNSRESNRDVYSMQYQKFALDELFGKEIGSILPTSQLEVKVWFSRLGKSNADAERTGIVTLDSAGEPQFIHRTFAEYFAAACLIEILKNDSRNQQVRNFFVAELFVEPQYKTIRAFLDCFLLGEIYAVENKSWQLDLRKHRDELDQTLYHIAVVEYNFEIVKFFLNRLGGHCKNDSEKQDTGINICDSANVSPLAVVLHGVYDLNVVKLLVDGGADIHWKNISSSETLLHVSVAKPDDLALVKYLCDKGANPNCENKNRDTPLHLAVASSYDLLEEVKYLCDKGANPNCENKNRETPLHLAVASSINKLEEVKYLCDKGANPNCENKNRETPLHLAVASSINKLEEVKYLCDKGANPNCENKNRETPLHLAVASSVDKLEVVKYLCDTGAYPNCENENRDTPLHVAVASSHNTIEEVKYLCDKGANLNCENENRDTPLHVAVASSHNRIKEVKYLCDKGANPNCENKNRETPLHLAVASSYDLLEEVKYLCDKGANPNCENKNRETPLHLAVASSINKLEEVKYLCDKGANLNCENKNRDTPLHVAVASSHNRLEVGKYLCDKGANPNCENKNRDTPLHVAVASSHNRLEVVKYLCDKGAYPNCENKNRETPLHLAVASSINKLEEVKYLCDKGANPNCENKNTETPLHLAAASSINKLEEVKYLCDKGANPNCENKDRETPLHLAAASSHNNIEVVKYLCDKGANISCRAINGNTPLDVAVLRGRNSATVEYLRSKVADRGLQDIDTLREKSTLNQTY